MSRDPDKVVALALRTGAYGAFALIAGGLLAHALGMDAAGTQVAWAGLLLLMFTPVLRILVAMVMFARAGEVRYTLVSLGVLLIVLASSWWGIAH